MMLKIILELRTSRPLLAGLSGWSPMTQEKISMATPMLSIWPTSLMVASVAEAMPYNLFSTQLITAFTLGEEKRANPMPSSDSHKRMSATGVAALIKARDARRLLTAVLEGVQGVEGEFGHLLARRPGAEHTALLAGGVVRVGGTGDGGVVVCRGDRG